MATEFSTRIRLCRGVPIDADYENTLFFDDEEKRRNYFRAVTNFAFDEQSYQRVNKNTLKVQKNRDVLDTINYMVIENVAHTDKWYYCFVLQVNYINENTTEIVYDIDVIQTWLGNCTIGKSFVERNHTLSDNVGENIVPENLEMGEGYVASKVDTLQMNCDSAVFVYESKDADLGEKVNFNWMYPLPARVIMYKYINEYEGEGVNRHKSSRNQIDEMRTFMQEYQAKPDGIYQAYLVPEICTLRFPVYTTAKEYTLEQYDRMIVSIPNNLDGYTNVRNNKLFTYPFTCLQVDNGEGKISTYRYEDFDGIKSFNIVGLSTPVPEVDVIPRHYKGLDINYTERSVMNGFPTLAYNANKAETYLNYNQNFLGYSNLMSAIGIVSGAVTGVAGVSAGDPTSAIRGAGMLSAGITSFKARMAKINDLRRVPDSVSNLTPTSILNIQLNDKKFLFIASTIRKEYAEMIDDFFTKYGYAINRVTDPILKARTEWTYIKTGGMVLFGKISQEVEVKIKQIFDSGITFWVNPLHVGDYTLDNEPLGERPEPTPTPDPEPSNFVPRLNDSKLLSSRYWQEPFNRYVTPPNAIHLPACSTYAYGRSLEIAYHYGNGALIMRSDGVAGPFNWQAGRGQYASPNSSGDHYAYPAGENCMDACVLGGWSADTHPRLGDVVSYYYEDSSIPDGHVLVVEQILHYDSNGHADWVRCSESNSGGSLFDMRELRRNYYRYDGGEWVATPASKGLWYDAQGRHPKKWCGGFAHNPAIDYVGG